MVIDKVFETLKEYDRTLTKKQFSEQYLGKSESYLYVMKHRNKEPSSEALLKCYFGLKNTAEQLAESGFTNINYVSNLKLADMVMEVMEQKIVEEL
jgi:hypothetical protein